MDTDTFISDFALEAISEVGDLLMLKVNKKKINL